MLHEGAPAHRPHDTFAVLERVMRRRLSTGVCVCGAHLEHKF